MSGSGLRGGRYASTQVERGVSVVGSGESAMVAAERKILFADIVSSSFHKEALDKHVTHELFKSRAREGNHMHRKELAALLGTKLGMPRSKRADFQFWGKVDADWQVPIKVQNFARQVADARQGARRQVGQGAATSCAAAKPTAKARRLDGLDCTAQG